MYNLPQEIEVWYIIPAIRKELAKVFTKKYKMTLEKAGDLLGVSKSAVSQYLKSKRGTAITLPTEIKRELEKSAAVIVNDEKKAVREILRVLEIIKQTKSSCKVCRKFNKGIMVKCEGGTCK